MAKVVIEAKVHGTWAAKRRVALSIPGGTMFFDLPEGESLRPWADAHRRGEAIEIEIGIPWTDAENREAAQDMAGDMRGEIEG